MSCPSRWDPLLLQWEATCFSQTESTSAANLQPSPAGLPAAFPRDSTGTSCCRPSAVPEGGGEGAGTRKAGRPTESGTGLDRDAKRRRLSQQSKRHHRCHSYELVAEALPEKPTMVTDGFPLQPWEWMAVRLHRSLTQHQGPLTDNALLFHLCRPDPCRDDIDQSSSSVLSPAAPPMLLQFLLQTGILSLPTTTRSQGTPAFDAAQAGRVTAQWFASHSYALPPAVGTGVERGFSLPSHLLPCVAGALAQSRRLTPDNATTWLTTLYRQLLLVCTEDSPSDAAAATAFPLTHSRRATEAMWAHAHMVVEASLALQATATAAAAENTPWASFSTRLLLHLVAQILEGMRGRLAETSNEAAPTEEESHLDALLLFAFLLKRGADAAVPPAASDGQGEGSAQIMLHQQWGVLVCDATSRMNELLAEAPRRAVILDYLIT